MSKIIIIVVFIFWVFLSFFYARSLFQPANSIANNFNQVATNQNNNSNSATYTLSTALVAQHNKASDCWATIGANVYNVSSYINSHPGGQTNITKYCGADMGAAFSAQGHSANASSILASFKIGVIGSAVSADTINNNMPAPVNNNQNSGGDDDEEEEDDD